MLACGTPQMGVLDTLKASALNSNLVASVVEKFRKTERSKFARPSDRSTLRPKLPKQVPGKPACVVAHVGTANAEVLNQHASVPTLAPDRQLPLCGSPTRFARSELPFTEPTFGIVLAATTLKSVPEAKLAIPFSCQPPKMASTPRTPVLNLLPAPKGSS